MRLIVNFQNEYLSFDKALKTSTRFASDVKYGRNIIHNYHFTDRSEILQRTSRLHNVAGVRCAIRPASTIVTDRNGDVMIEMDENSSDYPLQFKIHAECSTTRARVSTMTLPHQTVDTPVFMPVGTQGAMKGITVQQMEELGCQILLGNTYHLGHRPGPDLLKSCGGLHNFMSWPRAILTDSGGFQMVSLLQFAESTDEEKTEKPKVTEEGVLFQSPHDGSRMMMTPEHSIEIQNSIGGDIMMQLDDVVHTSVTGPRLAEATRRSIRWLDRCIAANGRPTEQNLFAIIQGGLDSELRDECLTEMTKRNVPGFAIGGLSGGEEKRFFWRTVRQCTGRLPRCKPRYLMGVGFPLDLVVCVALGVDMFDCVFPTRTARFGKALVPSGEMNLRLKVYEGDMRPVDSECPCLCCQRGYSRAFLHSTVGGVDTVACALLSIHNVAYLLGLMRKIRDSILSGCFPQFVRQFMQQQFPKGIDDYPDWSVEALKSVGIDLHEPFNGQGDA